MMIIILLKNNEHNFIGLVKTNNENTFHHHLNHYSGYIQPSTYSHTNKAET